MRQTIFLHADLSSRILNQLCIYHSIFFQKTDWLDLILLLKFIYWCMFCNYFSSVLFYNIHLLLIYIYLHSFKFLLCGLLYVFPVFSFYIKMDLAMLTETFHVL